MTKLTGQELKAELIKVRNKELNLINKINKKFDLILDKYRDYLSDNHKQLLIVKSIQDFNIECKLAIIIQTEDNYNRKNGNQLNLFD